METINKTFPVYAKDQVLSHLQLNASFNYLEEQIRITRTGLIAYGLIDGMEISFSDTSISISEGIAVTSLGFQIQWEATTFTHFESYEISKDFLEANIIENEAQKLLLNQAAIYKEVKNTILISKDNSKTPLSKSIIDAKVLMILFEYNFKIDDKCAIDNCDEKASNIDIKLRPILISKAQALLLDRILNPKNYIDIKGKAPQMPRFDVSKSIMFSKKDIENAYLKTFNNGFVEELTNHIQEIALLLKTTLGQIDEFKVLENPNLMSNLNKSKDIQYRYAWLKDIRNTTQEIYDFEKIWIQPLAKGVFPFHIMLANLDFLGPIDVFRTNYYPSAALSRQERGRFSRFKNLIIRLIHIISNFEIKPGEIKITPSTYGNNTLFNKAIPFYYRNQKSLSQVWSSDYPPNGYWSNLYSSDLQTISPLPYDQESFNFYRIEGITGKDYVDVIKQLSFIKEDNRLPFKIIGINALDIRNKEITFQNENINFRDLEVDYEIARKKVNNIGLDIKDWLNNNKSQLTRESILKEDDITGISNLILAVNNLFTDDLGSFLNHFTEFTETYNQLHSIYKFHRLCIASNTFLKEDLLDQLDQLNVLFLENPFLILFEEAKSRYVDGIKKTLLQKFYENNHGLEPLNGVTKGGTFVIVYLDSSILTPKKKVSQDPQLLIASAQVKTYKDNLNIPIEKENIFKTELANKKIVTLKSAQSAKIAEVSTLKKEELRAIEDVAELKMKAAIEAQAPKHLRDTIKGIYDQIIDKFQTEAIESLKDEGLVIADFCLPYICCEGETIINIILPTPEIPIIPIPQISIEKNKFCLNAPETLDVLVTPKDIIGKFNIEVVKLNGNKYQLNTSTLKVGSHKIIFTSDQKKDSNEIEIKILNARQENLTINSSENPLNPNDIFFKITNMFANETYEIDFGDGSDIILSNKSDFTHLYPSLEENKIYILIVTSEIEKECPFVTKIEVPIKAIIKPIFKIEKPIYCFDDQNLFCFEVDRNFTFNKLKNTDKLIFQDGKPCFLPSKQDIKISKDFTLEYAEIQLKIRILKTTAEFEYRKDLEALFALDQLADKYLWKFEILKVGTELISATTKFKDAHKSEIRNKVFKLDLSLIKQLEISRISFSLLASSECNQAEMKHLVTFEGNSVKIIDIE